MYRLVRIGDTIEPVGVKDPTLSVREERCGSVKRTSSSNAIASPVRALSIAWSNSSSDMRSLVGFARADGADDAEGVANETLVRVFRGIGDFAGNAAQFRAWIFTIARHVLVDERRRRSRRPAAIPTDPAGLPEVAVDGHVADGFDRVEHMLAGLTELQRDVVVLRVVAGLSVEETAAVVGRRPGAIRALQHRALEQLRRTLQPEP